MRVGIGVDAHRFAEGRRLRLGGVDIPSDAGLCGHSDADVLLHAIMDAILGAAGAGDIGEHFPDGDPAFQDASSLNLLEEVAGMVRSMGYRVANVDAVVICERPRIAPYRVKMCEAIAGALRIEADTVSVKGTTTEGMGFTGGGEGAAAIATVLLDQEGKG
jgi:2-C-methyl-D-erythritol 2,4-cyclodiphosphate synthase